MELALLLTVTYAITIPVGLLLERIRVPWLFSALLLGLGLAAWNPLHHAAESSEFQFLAELGMYLFLFVVGFEIDLKKTLSEGKFIFIAAAVIILCETTAGAIFIHFVFGTPWYVSAVVGLSFATVGEAVLLPILKEFKMARTDLGQTILGIGLVDNTFEVLAVVLLAVMLVTAGGGNPGGQPGSRTSEKAGASASGEGGGGSASASSSASSAGGQQGHQDDRALAQKPQSITLPTALAAIAGLFVLTWLFRQIPSSWVKTTLETMHVTRPHEVLMATFLIVFFGFLTLGSFGEAGALAALLAGLAIKPTVPDDSAEEATDNVIVIAYGVFGPVFFLSVGLEATISYLISVPLIVLSLMLIVKATKVGSSLLVGYRKLGLKKSLVMGVALSVKFSTSLVIIKLLLDTGHIDKNLYSVLIAAKIAFKFIVPFLLSWMLTRWDLQETGEQPDES